MEGRSRSWANAHSLGRRRSSRRASPAAGKPNPPRPQETTLRNAARTLWHQNKGTLGRPDAPKRAGVRLEYGRRDRGPTLGRPDAPKRAGAAAAATSAVATESAAHGSDKANVPWKVGSLSPESPRRRRAA